MFFRQLMLCLVAAVVSACGSKGGFRDTCTTAADCTGGLTCMPNLVQSGSLCGPKGSSTCGKTCTVKADCASIGASADCASDCSGAMTCISSSIH